MLDTLCRHLEVDKINTSLVPTLCVSVAEGNASSVLHNLDNTFLNTKLSKD